MQIRELPNRAQELFERLNPRERIVVSGGAVAALVILLATGWLLLAGGVETAALRTSIKRGQLAELVKLQGSFAKREALSQRIQRQLKGGQNLRLVGHVETAAKQAGVEIGNMAPREGTPDPDGVKETSVEIRLQRLSITRLQEFLKRLESNVQGVVRTKRLRVHKRYDDKTLLDVELTIATYTLEPAKGGGGNP